MLQIATGRGSPRARSCSACQTSWPAPLPLPRDAHTLSDSPISFTNHIAAAAWIWFAHSEVVRHQPMVSIAAKSGLSNTVVTRRDAAMSLWLATSPPAGVPPKGSGSLVVPQRSSTHLPPRSATGSVNTKAALAVGLIAGLGRALSRILAVRSPQLPKASRFSSDRLLFSSLVPGSATWW